MNCPWSGPICILAFSKEAVSSLSRVMIGGSRTDTWRRYAYNSSGRWLVRRATAFVLGHWGFFATPIDSNGIVSNRSYALRLTHGYPG